MVNHRKHVESAMEDQLVGTIVLTVNGQEFDCASVTPDRQTGRKLVSTMNSKARAHKQARTTKSITLAIDVYIAELGDFDWDSVENARLTIESIDGGHRTTYTGVAVTQVSEKYGEGSEATRSLQAYATDIIIEGL
jgi:hypothetical protein